MSSSDYSDSPPGLLSGLSTPIQQGFNAAYEREFFVTANDDYDALSNNEESNQISTPLLSLLVAVDDRSWHGSITNEDTAIARTLEAKIKQMEAQEAHTRKRVERLEARLGFSIEDESPTESEDEEENHPLFREMRKGKTTKVKAMMNRKELQTVAE